MARIVSHRFLLGGLGAASLLACLPVAAHAAPAPSAPKIVADLTAKTVPGLEDTGLWDYAVVDGQTRRAYVARGTGIMAIDLPSMHVTNALLASQHGHQVLPLPNNREILITNGDSNTAVIADGTTGRIRVTIPTGAKPDGAIFDQFTGDVLVMASDDGAVDLINPEAGTAVGHIAVGGKLEAAASDGKGHLFVNVEDENTLAVVDLTTHKLSTKIKLAGCDGPSGLAFDPKKSWVVSVCSNGVAKVTDVLHDKEVASLTIGRGPDAALFVASNEHVLVPSGGDGSLADIDLKGANPKVVRVIKTHPGARTAAYDPQTGHVFLPYGVATKGADGKRHLTAGSFGVLVVATR